MYSDTVVFASGCVTNGVFWRRATSDVVFMLAAPKFVVTIGSRTALLVSPQ